MHRVVITGLGCLTAIGNSPVDLWESLEAGRSGLLAHEPADGKPDASLRFSRTGQVRGFDVSALSSTQINTSERVSQFAIVAARQAAVQSGITQHHPAHRIAVMMGCSTAGRHTDEKEVVRVERDNGRVHPLAIVRSMASGGASQIAIDQQITGPSLTVSTACASGAHAIGLAFHMVRSGMVSAALAGGHEAPLTRTFLRGWDSMRAVSPGGCRPFSADRDGMSLAEGAGVLALETLKSAQARGAQVFAEIVGFGMSSDAHHITQPKPEGAAQAIVSALEDAALTLDTSVEVLKGQVNYVNAHGTGTQANDAAEAAALRLVFGERAAAIPVSGTKGFHGHAIGASSAIETVITALALHHRRLPFTLGTVTPDPAFDLDLIVGEPRPAEGTMLAVSNALAFGGLNAVLCLRSFS